MPKCLCCNRKTSIANSMKCKWCTQLFCIGCIPLEIHKCSCQEQCKNAALNILTNKLEEGKTKDVKLIKI